MTTTSRLHNLKMIEKVLSSSTRNGRYAVRNTGGNITHADYRFAGMTPWHTGPYSGSERVGTVPNAGYIEYLYDTDDATMAHNFWEMLVCRHRGTTVAVQVSHDKVAMYYAKHTYVPSQCGGRHLVIAPAVTTVGNSIVCSLDTWKEFKALSYGPQKDHAAWIEHAATAPVDAYFKAEYSIHQGITAITVAAEDDDSSDIWHRIIKHGVDAMQLRSSEKHWSIRWLREWSHASISLPPRRAGMPCSLHVIHAKADVTEILDKSYLRNKLDEDNCDLSVEHSRDPSRWKRGAIDSYGIYRAGDVAATAGRCPILSNSWQGISEKWSALPHGEWLTMWHVTAAQDATEDHVQKRIVDAVKEYMKTCKASYAGITSNLARRGTPYVMRALREQEEYVNQCGMSLCYAPDSACNQGEGYHALDSIFVVLNTTENP